MTRAEAEALVSTLRGWIRIQIHEGGGGYCTVTAVEPTSGRPMVYAPRKGMFESLLV